jgi:tetratricopeptide (TPR) repeat protein
MRPFAAALLLLALPAAAQDAASARKKYDAGDYAAAAAEYAKAADASPRDAALQYDAGNALFKAGKLGPSIAAYQRAFDLRPRSSDVRYNLSFALKRAGEELVPPGVPPLLYAAFHLTSDPELLGLQWLFCWAALLLAAAWLRRRDLRQELLTPLIWAAASWAFFGIWWLARWSAEPSALAVIVKPSAEIRSGPGDNFSVGFTAPEGRRVQILSEGGKWLEIGTLKEGAKRWISADSVERVGEAR